MNGCSTSTPVKRGYFSAASSQDKVLTSFANSVFSRLSFFYFVTLLVQANKGECSLRNTFQECVNSAISFSKVGGLAVRLDVSKGVAIAYLRACIFLDVVSFSVYIKY